MSFRAFSRSMSLPSSRTCRTNSRHRPSSSTWPRYACSLTGWSPGTSSTSTRPMQCGARNTWSRKARRRCLRPRRPGRCSTASRDRAGRRRRLPWPDRGARRQPDHQAPRPSRPPGSEQETAVRQPTLPRISKTVEIVEGVLSFSSNSWRRSVLLTPPFLDKPEITFVAKGWNAGKDPVIEAITTDKFTAKISSSNQQGAWIWRARGPRRANEERHDWQPVAQGCRPGCAVCVP
jgi:hypothetical protein